MIQLAETVVASANKRQNLASVRIECDQGDLRRGTRQNLGLKLVLSDFYHFGTLFLDLGIYFFQS